MLQAPAGRDLDEVPPTEAARAANTLRGYRSDWREFTTWTADHDAAPLPAAASTITGYLSHLAAAGAKVGTMSRRLSAITFTHQLHDLPDPTTGARVHTARTDNAATTPGL